MEERLIEIRGCLEIPPELKMADAIDLFLRWVEEQGWHFGGGFREIIDGKHDDLPESAFLFVGTIDEAVEKAKKAAR